ncbi:MAG: ATP-binding protein [Bacteroidota bacterium]
MEAYQDITRIELQEIKKVYFNDPEKMVRFKKGEVLIEQGQHNSRLFLILSGAVSGSLTMGGDGNEAFRSGKDMFIGVYSFFSHDHCSYTTVVAEEDTELAYIDLDILDSDGFDEGIFYKRFNPIIVREIYSRQLLAQKAHKARQNTMLELMEKEKMAVLGQLAAGISHELNNAISVVEQKTSWLADYFQDHILHAETKDVTDYFRKGLEHGEVLSSRDIRKNRKHLEEQFPQLNSDQSKRLARMGVTAEDLSHNNKETLIALEKRYQAWEKGLTIHNLRLAAQHTVHIVKSVKLLGSPSKEHKIPIDIGLSVEKALTLLKSQTREVEVELALQQMGSVIGLEGDFIQVWLNIVKNALESMRDAQTVEPRLSIQSKQVKGFAVISINDNGPGIPDSIKEKVFRPNFTTKVKGLSFGLGLGLSIVEQIVTNYDGKIALDSAPGSTTFQISIPTD